MASTKKREKEKEEEEVCRLCIIFLDGTEACVWSWWWSSNDSVILKLTSSSLLIFYFCSIINSIDLSQIMTIALLQLASESGWERWKRIECKQLNSFSSHSLFIPFPHHLSPTTLSYPNFNPAEPKPCQDSSSTIKQESTNLYSILN